MVEEVEVRPMRSLDQLLLNLELNIFRSFSCSIFYSKLNGSKFQFQIEWFEISVSNLKGSSRNKRFLIDLKSIENFERFEFIRLAKIVPKSFFIHS